MSKRHALWLFVFALAPMAAAGDDKAPKRFPDFAEVTKHMQKEEGLFQLYRYSRKDKNRDQEKLLAEIPAGLLNQDLLFATSISSGGSFTGWMWNDFLIRWEIRDRYLLMVTPRTEYMVKGKNPVNEVIEKTYNRTFLATIPIVTMNGGSPVVDLGSLLKSNFTSLPFWGSVRGDLSKITKVKNFKDNILIDIDMAVGRGSTGVAYAFRKLPDLNSYKPRRADQRVGYFLTARRDWTKPTNERDLFERYVNRWQLKKKDPSLDLSPPEKPIQFIIEKTVPIRWRRWVREGILSWNKAFEKIGYVDAIVVQQQTDDNEYADWDPEDARYNFFRWIVSGSAFAMGPSRVDPRTGQILDADIIMDEAMIRAWIGEFSHFTPETAIESKGPAFREWVQKRDGRLRRFPAGSVPETPMQKALKRLHDSNRLTCNLADGLQRQIAVAHHAMLATANGRKIPDRFFGEIIRETVAHEVGHTIGLRHNFKASSWLSLDEVRKRRMENDEPTTASVMDYNPILFFAEDEMDKVRHFTTPTIGPYDYWAVEYGYADPPKGKSEEEALAAVAGRTAEPGLAYATDEDTLWIITPDPHVFRWDMSNDPIAWTEARRAMCDKALENVTAWSVKKGEERRWLRRAFDILTFERSRNYELVGKLISGQSFNRDLVGDPGDRPSFEIVPAARQRAALDHLGQTLFSDDFFKFDPDLLNQLAASRWSHAGSWAPSRIDYPIHEEIAWMQFYTLVDITSEDVLQRVYDAELKSKDADKFTAAELITKTRDMVWKQLAQESKGQYSNANPFLSSISRSLHREYLDLVLGTIQWGHGWGLSADPHGMLRHAMRELSQKIGTVLGRGDALDFASQAHLVECKSRIDRILDAKFNAR